MWGRTVTNYRSHNLGTRYNMTTIVFIDIQSYTHFLLFINFHNLQINT